MRPSCKKEAVSRREQLAPPLNEQDVEMIDVSHDHSAKRGLKPRIESSGFSDPIESYGSAKPNSDAMEVDSDGANPSTPLPKQSDREQTKSGYKPSKEAIATVASPQKPRQDLKQPVSPKKLPASSTANNNTASRPPGITILQHAAILAKSTEKKELPVAKGLESRHFPAPGNWSMMAKKMVSLMLNRRTLRGVLLKRISGSNPSMKPT